MATLSTAARNAMCDALVDLFDIGTANPGATLEVLHSNGTTVLVAFELAATSFGSAGASNAGEAVLASTPYTETASETGTATTARIKNRDGTVVVSGLTVGTSGTQVVVSSTSVTSGQTINLNSGTITMPAS